MAVDVIIKGLAVFAAILVILVVILVRSCWAEQDAMGENSDRMPGWFVAITSIGMFGLFILMMWTYSEKKHIEMEGNNVKDSVIIIAPNNKKALDFAFDNVDKLIVLEGK